MDEAHSLVTPDERSMMAVTERVVSFFSIAGIMFIFLTYTFNSSFRRPINRLVFLASFGNLGMNVAALIAEQGPANGPESALCQVQGFLVQMFLGVDAYWSLCMAINVYLIFFGHYSAQKLRRLDIWYIFCCYGLALVPSLVFLFIDTDKGKVYGDAILWCWIQTKWAVLRIGLMYSISWIAIALALAVYVLAAADVYQRRHQLQPGFMNPLNDSPLKFSVTTEVSITYESASRLELHRIPSGPQQSLPFPFSASEKHAESQNYDVSVRALDARRNDSTAGPRALTRSAAEHDANTEALLYARAAFFYFVALLAIWLPASANRAYAVARPDRVSFPLAYASALLLSAQGFFNVIVYTVTSRGPMRELLGCVSRGRCAGGRSGGRRRSEDELGIATRRSESRDT